MLHVLSIDDSKAVHAFISLVFEGVAAKVFHAFDGQEGLDVVRDRKEDFDIILLDWEMPRLTGIETLRKIRELGVQTPIVMLTSKNSPEDIVEALGLGASEYVMKPFTRDILLEKLESVIGRKLV